MNITALVILKPKDNPLYIVNKKSGNFTRIYQDENGAIVREIGYDFNKKGMKRAPDGLIFASFPDSDISATLTIKTIPGYHVRFGKLPSDQGITIGDIVIPPGAVIKAKTDNGVNGSPSDISKYGNINFYDPVTGALIATLRPQDLKQNGYGKMVGNALHEKITTDERGQKIRSTMNSLELFDQAGSPEAAARAFANMQDDSSDRLQAGINTSKGDGEKTWKDGARKATDGVEGDVTLLDGLSSDEASEIFKDVDPTTTFIKVLINEIEGKYFEYRDDYRQEVNEKGENSSVARGAKRVMNDAMTDYENSFDFLKDYMRKRDINMPEMNRLALKYNIDLPALALRLGFNFKELNLK